MGIVLVFFIMVTFVLAVDVGASLLLGLNHHELPSGVTVVSKVHVDAAQLAHWVQVDPEVHVIENPLDREVRRFVDSISTASGRLDEKSLGNLARLLLDEDPGVQAGSSILILRLIIRFIIINGHCRSLFLSFLGFFFLSACVVIDRAMWLSYSNFEFQSSVVTLLRSLLHQQSVLVNLRVLIFKLILKNGAERHLLKRLISGRDFLRRRAIDHVGIETHANQQGA